MSFFRSIQTGRHRDTHFAELVMKVDPQHQWNLDNCKEEDIYWTIQGVHCLPALLITGEWWVVPAYYGNEDAAPDQGPFTSIEDAVVFCNLMDNT